MPKIQWTNLPAALRHHLFDRLEDRQITVEDLYRLKVWRESEPEAPDGLWYKDFGSFKICGQGRHPKTFLLRGKSPRGSLCEPRLLSPRRPSLIRLSLSQPRVLHSGGYTMVTRPYQLFNRQIAGTYISKLPDEFGCYPDVVSRPSTTDL